MSIKPHDNRLTVIVRTKESSKCLDLVENESNATDYVYLAKQLYPDVHVESFENCTNLKVRFIENFRLMLNFVEFRHNN